MGSSRSTSCNYEPPKEEDKTRVWVFISKFVLFPYYISVQSYETHRAQASHSFCAEGASEGRNQPHRFPSEELLAYFWYLTIWLIAAFSRKAKNAFSHISLMNVCFFDSIFILGTFQRNKISFKEAPLSQMIIRAQRSHAQILRKNSRGGI